MLIGIFMHSLVQVFNMSHAATKVQPLLVDVAHVCFTSLKIVREKPDLTIKHITPSVPVVSTKLGIRKN